MGTAASARIVVIGASAGGLDAVPEILCQLPDSLVASVLVVQHLRPGSSEHFMNMLQGRCALPVQWADNKGVLEPGHVYVARPDLHLLVGAKHTLLVDGPRENLARPSISRLFRSAAAHHGARVVGVLLTGELDDGTSGLVAIRRCGGAVLVQDPRNALFPEMPRHAIDALKPDAILPLSELAHAIEDLTSASVDEIPIPADIATEAELDVSGRVDHEAMRALWPRAPITCSECGGPMWQVGGRCVREYRCVVGHASSTHSLLADKAGEVERTLWAAARALEERSTLFEGLREDVMSCGSGETAAEYGARSREASAQAMRARELLLYLRRMNEGSSSRPATESERPAARSFPLEPQRGASPGSDR
jgi:two-component system, chemotaxis family, protein-glutamate methylesterase/glutaminase